MEDRRRTYIMFAIVTLACAFGSLAQTATNSMLGGVQASFGTDENTGQWLTTVYMLTIGITVPLVTHLSRRFSVRRLILVSLAFTLVGSLVSAVAPTFLVLVCGRVLQAIGTGITLPILQMIAMTRFPPGQNATAMGIAGIAMGFAPNIGPLIGGVLVGTLGWRSFFWMLLAATAALAVATLLLVSRHENKPQDAHLDFASFLLSTLGFGGLLLGFSNAANMPLAEAAVWLPVLVGVVCLVWFIARQRRIEHPLISMDIFGSRTYVVSFVAQNCLFASFMGITLIVPLFVINVMQLTPVDAGLVFLPVTVLAIVFNPLAGILSDKIGARPVVVGASVALFVGAFAMAFIDETTPLWLVTLWQVVRGIGISSLIGPLNSWGMSGLAPKNMIDASAFFTTTRQASASLGTALMMLVLAVCGSTAAVGASAAFGFHLAFGLSAAFSLAVLACAVLFVRDR